MKNIKNKVLIGTLIGSNIVPLNIATNVFAENEIAENNDLFKLSWQSKLGGNKYETFNDITLVKDGGYIAVGQSSLTETIGLSDGDGLLVKYSKNGTEEWRQILEGDETDKFYSVIETKDGGFATVGISYSTNLGFENTKMKGHTILTKYDKEGKQEWLKAFYNDEQFDKLEFKDICETNEGDFIIVGEGLYSNELTGFISKFSKDGKQEWTEIKSDENNLVYTNKVILLNDGNILVAGESKKYDEENTSYYIEKLNSKGESLWKKTFLNDGDTTGEISSIIEDSKNNIVVVGTSNLNDGIIMNLDKSNGNVIWKSYMKGSGDDSFIDVVENSKKELIVIGETNSTDLGINKEEKLNVFAVKYDLDGYEYGRGNISNILQNKVNIKSAVIDSNDEIILAGEIGLEKEDKKVNSCSTTNPCIQYDAFVFGIKESISKPVQPDIDEDVKGEDCSILPVIKGENTTIYIGDKFNPLSIVTATDSKDGNITSKIEVLKNTVDTTKAGVYNVTYKVVNSCDVKAEKTIIVTVKEKTVINNNANTNNGTNEKPKTGDSLLLFGVTSVISTTGLVVVNKKKKND